MTSTGLSERALAWIEARGLDPELAAKLGLASSRPGAGGELIPIELSERTGCWLWRGHVRRDGYGAIQIGPRAYPAHRVFYAIKCGEIPEGKQLDHLCRVRNCCNPEHLEPVTARENIRRGQSEAASRAKRATCPAGHPLSGENLYVAPNGTRKCKTCRRGQVKAFRERRYAI